MRVRFTFVWFTAMLAGTGCAYDLNGGDSAGGSSAADGDAAGADGGSAGCVPGLTAFCDCTAGGRGIQTCSPQGAFGACDCTATADTGSSGSEAGPDGSDGAIAWTPTCASNRWWTGGHDGGSRMYPGRNCITCHATGEGGPTGGFGEEEEEDEDGPRLPVAGTVYPALHEEDDCYGTPDAVVRIEAADGAVYRLTTNTTGNFSREPGDGPIAVPYTATVVYGGREIAMQTPQTVLNCANCHTVAGTAGAPGRIVVP